MEQLQLFDENKNMLNEGIGRDKKLSLPSGKYFMVILLFIENDKHEFLIQKTSDKRDSIYATTGGHVTYKDDNIKTVVKEAKEELGIDIDPKDLVFISSIKYSKAYNDVFYIHKNIDLKDIKLQEEEVDSVEWMSIDKINKLIEEDKFRKGNIIQFKKVLEYLNEKNITR